MESTHRHSSGQRRGRDFTPSRLSMEAIVTESENQRDTHIGTRTRTKKKLQKKVKVRDGGAVDVEGARRVNGRRRAKSGRGRSNIMQAREHVTREHHSQREGTYWYLQKK